MHWSITSECAKLTVTGVTLNADLMSCWVQTDLYVPVFFRSWFSHRLLWQLCALFPGHWAFSLIFHLLQSSCAAHMAMWDYHSGNSYTALTGTNFYFYGLKWHTSCRQLLIWSMCFRDKPRTPFHIAQTHAISVSLPTNWWCVWLRCMSQVSPGHLYIVRYSSEHNALIHGSTIVHGELFIWS